MTYGKCQQDGCTLAAQFAPKICVPAKGWPAKEEYSLSAIMGLELCQKHCMEFPASEQFSDKRTSDIWRTVFDLLLKARGKGAVPPDYKRAFIVALPLDSRDYLGFKSMQAKKQ